jgi:LysW-gamma-L-lysine carboxypeptidase
MDEGQILERLVAHYSPSGHERGAVVEFVRLSRELGYRARIDAVGNGIAEVGRGLPTILFLGHIDTVPGRRATTRRRGRVHGRGAVDAKGALAMALGAGRTFAGPGTFRVVAGVGEETDSRGAKHLLRGAKPAVVIAGEPSGWDGITIGYKGDLRIAATFRRRRSHWSSPYPTASDLAMEWVSGVRSMAESHRRESPFRSLTVKAVGMSSDANGDPEVATVTLDLRIPPGLSTTAVLEKLPTTPISPKVRILARVEPIEVPRTDPVASALGTSLRASGRTPILWRRSGTSDLNVVAPAWGVSGVAYGPGNSRLDHTNRESLSLAELRRATTVLRDALVGLAQTLSSRREASD